MLSRVEPGGHDQRLRHVPEQQLGLGIAQDLRAVVLLRGRRLDDREASNSAIMNRRAKRGKGAFIAGALAFFALNPR